MNVTRMKSRFSCLFLSLLFFSSCRENIPVYETDLLVVGGGASGIMAGIQASRMGIKTMVTEETDWLGGMLTAAGVSAIDGDHHLPSGLWGEFRSRLYQYYGGKDKVSTGWVSNTLFEPNVGASILLDMAEEEENLSLQFHYQFLQVTREGNKVTGAYFEDFRDHAKIRVKAKITIDATELGDVLANAGCQYAIGMDYNEMTGQHFSADSSKNTIQAPDLCGHIEGLWPRCRQNHPKTRRIRSGKLQMQLRGSMPYGQCKTFGMCQNAKLRPAAQQQIHDKLA